MPIALDAAIASLAGFIGALAPSIGVGDAWVAPMLLDDAADIDGVGVVVVVVSAGAVLLQPLNASAAAAMAKPSGKVIRFVMSVSEVEWLASMLRARVGSRCP